MSHDEAIRLFKKIDDDSSVLPARVRESREKAWTLLINRATNTPADTEGNLDPEQYHLDLVACRGTAFGDLGLRRLLGGLVEVVVKENRGGFPTTAFALSKDSIWESEKRLNTFLKRLGRALERSKKTARNSKTRWPYAPDWARVQKIDEMVVQGWCESIRCYGYVWPPLCALTIPAIFQFLHLCEPPLLNSNNNLEAFRQQIRRLGLVSLSRGKVREVKRTKQGDLLFG